MAFKNILVNCITLSWETKLQSKDEASSNCSYLQDRFTKFNFNYRGLYLDYSMIFFLNCVIYNLWWKEGLDTILVGGVMQFPKPFMISAKIWRTCYLPLDIIKSRFCISFESTVRIVGFNFLSFTFLFCNYPLLWLLWYANSSKFDFEFIDNYLPALHVSVKLSLGKRKSSNLWSLKHVRINDETSAHWLGDSISFFKIKTRLRQFALYP